MQKLFKVLPRQQQQLKEDQLKHHQEKNFAGSTALNVSGKDWEDEIEDESMRQLLKRPVRTIEFEEIDADQRGCKSRRARSITEDKDLDPNADIQLEQDQADVSLHTNVAMVKDRRSVNMGHAPSFLIMERAEQLQESKVWQWQWQSPTSSPLVKTKHEELDGNSSVSVMKRLEAGCAQFSIEQTPISAQIARWFVEERNPLPQSRTQRQLVTFSYEACGSAFGTSSRTLIAKGTVARVQKSGTSHKTIAIAPFSEALSRALSPCAAERAVVSRPDERERKMEFPGGLKSELLGLPNELEQFKEISFSVLHQIKLSKHNCISVWITDGITN